MSFLNRVSLVSGWLPWALALAGFGALATVFSRWPRRRWWALPLLFVASVAVLGGFSHWWQLPHRLHGTWPRTFFVWCALPLVALTATVLTWRRGRIRHHIAGCLAFVLLAGFAADRVDVFYGAVPTVGDLIGAPLPGQLSGPALLARTAEHTFLPTKGVVIPLKIPGIVSHFHARPGYVWLPPIWFSHHRPHLPALELLTGAPGAPGLWMRGGHAVQTLNAYAAAHGGWGPVVVVADSNGSLLGDTECVDGPRGNADTYLSVDVVVTINRLFGVLTRPRSWAIAGYSTGGTCALVLALRHPNVYGAFGDFSGDPRPNGVIWRATLPALYGRSSTPAREYDPGWLLDHHRFPNLFAWFESGQSDTGYRLPAMQQLTLLARRADAHAIVFGPPGAHDLYFWSQCLRSALPVLMAAISPQIAQHRTRPASLTRPVPVDRTNPSPPTLV